MIKICLNQGHLGHLDAIDFQKNILNRSNDFSRSSPPKTTKVVTTSQKHYLNIYICRLSRNVQTNPFSASIVSNIRILILKIDSYLLKKQ